MVGRIRMMTEEEPGVFCNPEWNQTHHLYIEEVGGQTYVSNIHQI